MSQERPLSEDEVARLAHALTPEQLEIAARESVENLAAFTVRLHGVPATERANYLDAITFLRANRPIDIEAAIASVLEYVRARSSFAALDAVVLSAAAEIRRRAHSDYARLKHSLKLLHVAVTDWDKSVTEYLRAAPKNQPSRDVATRPLPDYAQKLRQKYDEIAPDVDNLILVFATAPEWEGRLRYNLFTNEIEVHDPPFHEIDQPADRDLSGVLNDDSITRMVAWFARTLGISPSPQNVYAAARVVAQRTSHHPVRDYLAGLTWDGKPRLATFLRDYFGAQSESPEYLERIGTYALVAAVARVMNPGCKCDYVVVVEGTQGKKKSTAIRVLFVQPSWSAEFTEDIGSKDARIFLHGLWAAEIAELDAFSKPEASRIKAFITIARDKVRVPYGKQFTVYPRQLVFWGTVNDRQYLRDATGGRRFWPFMCGQIDIAAIERDRDQLWAEALHLFRAGHRWWPDAEEEELLREEQEKRYRPDPWEPVIVEFLDTLPSDRLDFVPTADLLAGALQKPRGQQTEADMTRLGRIMARLGWEHGRVRMPKATAAAGAEPSRDNRRYGYHRPVDWPDPWRARIEQLLSASAAPGTFVAAGSLAPHLVDDPEKIADADYARAARIVIGLGWQPALGPGRPYERHAVPALHHVIGFLAPEATP